MHCLLWSKLAENAKTKDFKVIFLLYPNIQFVTTYCHFHIIKNLFYFASLNRFLYFGVLKVKMTGSRFLIH